ncbi:MAG TPA: PKD domain-containing protein [Gemmatimonadaceae bacterium]|nr:PKD domain-containing protein [Gemmatimonadaceae bacterium]
MHRRDVVAVLLLLPSFAACGADDALSPRVGAPETPAVAAGAADAPVVSLTLLPAPTGMNAGTVANDISNDGKIVGWGFGPFSGGSQPIIWVNGTPSFIFAGAFSFTQAFAISPNGAYVVGRSGFESITAKAVRWTSLTTFPELLPSSASDPGGFKPGIANGVNDAGNIAAELNDLTLSGGRRYPVLWTGATPTDLAPGEQGRALDVNNANQVVGVRAGVPFLWQAGTSTPLPTLGDPSTALANAINSAGTVAGRTGDRAVVWKNGALQVLTDVPTGSIANDINDSEQVVGAQNGRAFFWQAGIGMVDLGPGQANAINNQGVIVGVSNGLNAAVWRLTFPLTARITGPDEIRKRVPATFTATVSGGTGVTVTWDFGDETPTETGMTVTHEFKKQGTYTVTATVRNSAGLTSTASTTISVENGPKPKEGRT